MRYKTYLNDEDEEVEFTVFIVHGHSEEWRKVERYIKDELRFNAIVLKESFSGKVILEKFKDAVWYEADCAVAIMSPDEKLQTGQFRTRQNVLFETGYCLGVFESYYGEDYDFESAIILKESKIDFKDVSDLLGVEVIDYTEQNIEATFLKLGKALKNIYKELSS